MTCVFISTKTRVVMVGKVERLPETSFHILMLFLSTLNELSFTMLKLLFIYMESGGLSECNFADVFMFKKRILLFNRKVHLLRNPFHNVVRHLEY